MSFCSFIATNYEMPEVDKTKAKYITVKEAIELKIKPHELVPWEKMDPNAQILFFENEDDLNELVIKKDAYYDVSGYTSYPFIYEVNFIYSELRAKQLLEYLKENIREGQILELWRVWIGHNDNELNIPYIRCNYEELTLNHLVQMYNWNHEKYKEQYCIVLER
ncbi:magnesium transporter [Metabacillus fastidiosus]|uniref:Magnesium transporter n=1 Tax=Metabacillus fastidiosus TaxID=1458 RepID=A0ABU6NZE8_9BACI|nr:magnesium transporter [Metabacillus fastidiosus]